VSTHASTCDEILIGRLRDENAWLRSVIETLIGQDRTHVADLVPEAPPDGQRRARRIDPPPDGPRRTKPNDGGRAVAELIAEGRTPPTDT